MKRPGAVGMWAVRLVPCDHKSPVSYKLKKDTNRFKAAHTWSPTQHGYNDAHLLSLFLPLLKPADACPKGIWDHTHSANGNEIEKKRESILLPCV